MILTHFVVKNSTQFKENEASFILFTQHLLSLFYTVKRKRQNDKKLNRFYSIENYVLRIVQRVFQIQNDTNKILLLNDQKSSKIKHSTTDLMIAYIVTGEFNAHQILKKRLQKQIDETTLYPGTL
ncbi:Hypothetical_protein [Hexamita inflata]|uniref:Hypothetical_protein n=1 Tax=Hexamita inflata TaxID=28002 RepID=A0AA86NTT6_9EUKA|nr:Hypothetical protein HINF_LOCUS12371 [Hexamita inflata]